MLHHCPAEPDFSHHLNSLDEIAVAEFEAPFLHSNPRKTFDYDELRVVWGCTASDLARAEAGGTLRGDGASNSFERNWGSAPGPRTRSIVLGANPQAILLGLFRWALSRSKTLSRRGKIGRETQKSEHRRAQSVARRGLPPRTSPRRLFRRPEVCDGAERRLNGGPRVSVHCVVHEDEVPLTSSSSSVAVGCEFREISHIRFSMGKFPKLATESASIACHLLDLP
jgi:hypothetical protein